jgi:hypothetical protein
VLIVVVRISLISLFCVLLGCRDYFKNSLFFMGEFGGNDYTFFMAAGKTALQIARYVPKVVQAISEGVEVYIYITKLLDA